MAKLIIKLTNKTRGDDMDQKLLGTTITNLRKKKQMTQAVLANLLNVSDKTVSKWETGLGYPEISLLPKLAAILGVSVDYLQPESEKASPSPEIFSQIS